MANVAANVIVGLTGVVRFAPLATPLPVTVAGAPNVAFLDVGYLADSGFDKKETNSTQNIKAWQNGDVVRVVQTEHSLRFAFTMIESNANALAAYWGNYAAGVSTVNGLVLAHRAWLLDVADGIDNKIRYAVPDGQIVSRGDISHVNGDAVSYPVEIECFADGTGQKAYVYYDTALIP